MKTNTNTKPVVSTMNSVTRCHDLLGTCRSSKSLDLKKTPISLCRPWILFSNVSFDAERTIFRMFGHEENTYTVLSSMNSVALYIDFYNRQTRRKHLLSCVIHDQCSQMSRITRNLEIFKIFRKEVPHLPSCVSCEYCCYLSGFSRNMSIFWIIGHEENTYTVVSTNIVPSCPDLCRMCQFSSSLDPPN